MANPNIVNVGTINGKTIGAKLSTTSATALVTGASNKVTKVNCVYVSNTDGANAQEITLEKPPSIGCLVIGDEYA